METQEKYDETQALETARLKLKTPSPVQFTCNECLQQFTNINEYEEHVLTHQNLGHICMYCGKKAQSIEEMHRHVALHGQRVTVYPCPLCQSVFKTSLAKKKHMSIHTAKTVNVKKTKSVIAVTSASATEAVPITQTIVLPLPNLVSSDEVQVINIEDMNEEFTILEVSSVMCGDCGLSCADEEALNEHLLQKRGNGSKCSLCPEILPNDCALNVHSRTGHNKDIDTVGLYQCKICAMSFTSRNMLHTHKAEHTDKMKECKFCGALFAGRSGLYVHRRRVHDKRQDFKCQFCGKAFAFKTQRDIHVRIHTNERPYACGVCGARFKAQSGLVVHRRTHTDERPFECQVCGKRLRLGYNLKLHLRTHTGEKPYVCTVCGRGFAQPGDCKKHMKIHGVQPPPKSQSS